MSEVRAVTFDEATGESTTTILPITKTDAGESTVEFEGTRVNLGKPEEPEVVAVSATNGFEPRFTVTPLGRSVQAGFPPEARFFVLNLNGKDEVASQVDIMHQLILGRSAVNNPYRVTRNVGARPGDKFGAIRGDTPVGAHLIRLYATLCRSTNPQLADDLLNCVDRAWPAHLAQHEGAR